MKKITDEWIAKAEKDYLTVNQLFKAEVPVPEAICFHSQQCVEKYMKAILQENEVEFDKIHDLDVLLEQCKSFIPELETYKNELTDLSTYAVDIRYPGIDVSKEEAKECVETMERVRKIIRNYFGLKQ